MDRRTVQELGGWRTLSMVQRYSHLAPERLAAAVERLVAPAVTQPAPVPDAEEVRQKFGAVDTRAAMSPGVVS